MPITNHTRESLITFEESVRQSWESGELPSLCHLCGGDEGPLLDIFQRVRPNDWVFAPHRAHYLALLKGIPEDKLMEFIKHDSSMFIFDRERRFYQSAILGGCCGIAVGVAQAIKQSGEDAKVFCFLGDGGVENGALHSAAMYASGHDLPIEFWIQDNDRQVDTPKLARRGGKYSIIQGKKTSYEPMWPYCVWRYEYKPTWPHAGSGCAHKITFKRTTPL